MVTRFTGVVNMIGAGVMSVGKRRFGVCRFEGRKIVRSLPSVVMANRTTCALIVFPPVIPKMVDGVDAELKGISSIRRFPSVSRQGRIVWVLVVPIEFPTKFAWPRWGFPLKIGNIAFLREGGGTNFFPF